MTADGRLTVILFAIGLAVGLLGWLLRRSIAGNDRAIRDNSAAVRELAASVGKLSERVATVEGRLSGRR